MLKCSWLNGNYLRYLFVSFFSCLGQKDITLQIEFSALELCSKHA